MGSRAGVRRNTLFAFLSQAVRLVANVVLFVGLARMYGPEDFGRFTAAHTLSTVFILLADFGLDVLTASEIARTRLVNRNPTGELFFVKLMFATVASIAMAVVILFRDMPLKDRILSFVFCPYIFFSAIQNFFFAVFKGNEQLHHETRISFLSNIFLLVLVVGLGVFHFSIVIIAAGFVASRVVAVALALRASKSFGGVSPRGSLSSVRPLVGAVAIFGLHSLFGNLFFVQDTLLLSWWTSDRIVGLYQSAFKIVSLALLIADVIFYTMLPVLSRLYESDHEGWIAGGRLVHKTLLFSSLVIGFVLIVYPDVVINHLYGGSEYTDAIPLLRIFGVTVVIRYVVDTSATMLTASRRQSRRLIIVAAAVVANLALNAYAIPRYGAMGACVVSLVTNILVGAGYVAFARDISLRWFVEPRNIIPVVSAVFLGLFFWTQRDISFWIAAPVALSLIIIISFAFGFSRPERQRLFTMRGLVRDVGR